MGCGEHTLSGLSLTSETQFYQVPKVVQIQGLNHTKQIQNASVFSPVNGDNTFLTDVLWRVNKIMYVIHL